MPPNWLALRMFNPNYVILTLNNYMPQIELETVINSEIEICFDLSRNIDLHKISTASTKEKAIDGKTTGLINLNEFVTWQATHFGISQKLTSKITQYNRPFHFRDEQLKSAFKYLIHDHNFQAIDGKVIMKDVFKFQSPFGYLGKLFDNLVMTNYLRKLLLKRNDTIREYAETEKWKSVLNSKNYGPS
jgi:ligand-binding SRPBCC domain-containing protein